jgi:hypothetical protein
VRALLKGEAVPLDAAGEVDPAGPFCAAVTTGSLAARWHLPGVWSARLDAGPRTWVLVQTADPRWLAERVPSPAGVGSERHGWDGARQSLCDAGLALGVAGDDVARFDDEWVLATVFGARQRLADVTAPARAVAHRSTHLADAVQAFADHRLSVVGAARALQVHPNTVIYRLERWHGLTGWDPRTFRGLVASVACLKALP